MKRIPLLVPRMPKADRLVRYLEQIDHNQWYTNFGPLSRELERRVIQDAAPNLSLDNVTTVSNCTVGLELALQALGLKPGARVLIPAITFVATATAVLRIGMVPVLSDIDPQTWVLTPEIAEAAATANKIDAIMPVATFGYAHDTAAWDSFTEKTGIPVVIDAAGAYGNQRAGRLTDVVYSFHATKSFGAAEGGAVLSADTARIQAIRRLANFGIETASGRLCEVGTNAKMSEYHCAIGLASFDEWEETRRIRRELFRRYQVMLHETCPELTHQAKDPSGIYPLMSVALPKGARVEQIQSDLAKHNVETRRWYSPSLHMHPALESAPRADSLAVATDLGSRIIGLPFFMELSDPQLKHVCDSLKLALATQAQVIA